MPAPRRDSCPHCGAINKWNIGIQFHVDCWHVIWLDEREKMGIQRVGYISATPPAHVPRPDGPGSGFERDAQPTRTHCIEHGAVTYEAVVMWESAEELGAV